jgi:PAS domain S-box-containing protein
VVKVAKVSIHCDGTDIYIVPNGNGKSKPDSSAPDDLADYAPEKLQRVYSLGIVHEDGGEAGENHKGHNLLPYEFKAVKRSGKANDKGILVLEKVAAAEYKGNGRRLHSIVDITEQKRLEDAIAESEERYRTILQVMQDIYFEVDLAGNFIFVSDSVCRILGYSTDELIGTSFRDHMTDESAESVYQAFNNTYQTGKAIRSLTCEVIRQDGTMGIILTSAYLLTDARREVVGFRGVGRDVTEHAQMEEALKQAAERCRSVLEDMDESYCEVDLSGNFAYVNDAACRQLRRSKEELIGMNYRCYIPEEEIESVYQTWNKVYRTGEPLTAYHHANVKKFGQKVYLEDSVSPLRNNEGKIIGFRSICRDATERKNLTQKLVELKWPAVTC